MELSRRFLLRQSICRATGSLSLFMKLPSRQTEANKRRYNMFASTSESVLSLPIFFLRLVLVTADSPAASVAVKPERRFVKSNCFFFKG